MTHTFPLRVYYEDTDLAGLVYYANYLKFIERARSEWVRTLGIDQAALKAQGTVFAVRRVVADYLAPARYDDMLDVITTPLTATAARLILRQDIARRDTPLFTAEVTLVALGDRGQPQRLPATLRQILATGPG